MFVTYVIYSRELNRYYTGNSNDLERRLKEHNSGRNSATRGGFPWEIVFSEQFQSREEAVQLEFQIKKRGVRRFLQDRGVVMPTAS